jgi:hypothetical protein
MSAKSCGLDVYSGRSLAMATAAIIVSGEAIVAENVIESNDGVGLVVAAGANAVLTGNTICDNGTDISISEFAKASVDADNDICDAGSAG